MSQAGWCEDPALEGEQHQYAEVSDTWSMPEEERRDRTSGSTNHKMLQREEEQQEVLEMSEEEFLLLENPDMFRKPPPLRKMPEETEGQNNKRIRIDVNLLKSNPKVCLKI